MAKEDTTTALNHVRFGSKADIAAPPTNVRFTPESGHRNSVVECPLCAKSRHLQCGKQRLYSITSLARPRSDNGTSIPNALAVLRLMISSTFVACCTGNSAGFSPLRILPV